MLIVCQAPKLVNTSIKLEVHYNKFCKCAIRPVQCYCFHPVRIITGMDRNGPECACITGMDIKINLFYATSFIILP